MAPVGVVPGTGRKRAFVTFLAGAGDYIQGALALAKGLRRVRSAYPLVVAVLEDVPEDHRQLLRMYGCSVRQIDPIRPHGCDTFRFSMPHYVLNFSKLRIWTFDSKLYVLCALECASRERFGSLVVRLAPIRSLKAHRNNFEELEKFVYLDADVMVYDNIDELFDLPNGRFYGVMDCFCEKTWSHSLQYKVKYCQQCPDRNPWPRREHGEPPAKYFNAGVFVHEASKDTFRHLMNALHSTPLTPFAEQDFLNTFFKHVFSPIPLIYNLVMAMLWRHPDKVDLEKVKVVHYCATGSKPWQYTGKEENMNRDDVKWLVKRWWSVYDEAELHPAINVNMQ